MAQISRWLYLPNAGTDPKRRGLAHNTKNYISPEEYNMPYEDFYLRASDNIKIHAWFVKQSAQKLSNAPTVVFFHGNAGNIGYRLPLIKTLFDQLGANILAVQYRGYGNSEGTPSEAGLTRDAQAALDWLATRADIDGNKIFLYGQSLGGGVSIKTAHANQDKVCEVCECVCV